MAHDLAFFQLMWVNFVHRNEYPGVAKKLDVELATLEYFLG
jgi:hypothetical protein